MNRLLHASTFTVCLSVLLLGGVLAPAPSAAQDDGEEIRTADYDVQELSFPDLQDFETPEPERLELDNGLTVFLLEDHELPQVNAVARIGTGSVFEPAEKRGLASITGNVMRTGGTASMAPDSLNQTLENIGATVETSIGQTSGSAYMSTLTDRVDTVLPVFADVLRRPAFAEDKVQQAESRQKSSISRRNDNARQIAFREFDKLIYGEDSPYAQTPEYFTVDRIERQDLVDFHEEYYHPSNVILSVWGDFDAEAMEQKIRDQFGDWDASQEFEPPTPPEPTTTRERSVNFVQKDDVSQSTVLLGHPGRLTRDDPDYAPVTIMNEVLSGGFSGRLFQNVRREKGLAYSVFGSYSAGYDRSQRFFSGVSSKSETTVEATKAVVEEIERMRQEPPTDEELGLAKDSYLNSFVFNFDTKREILSRLMTYEYYDYPSDFLQQTRDAVENVTAADVQQVAEKYLYPEESHVLIVGRQQDFGEPLSALTEDGEVNEIDISIPTEPPGDDAEQEQVSAESKAAGLEVLRQARNALGGEAFADIENLRTTGAQSVSRGGQTFDMNITIVQALPDRYRAEVETPQGTMVLMVDGDEGKQMMGERSQTMSTQQVEQQKVQLWRDILFLMANLDHDDLVVQDQGTEAIEGSEYRALKVTPPVGDSYTLYLDPESMRPVRFSYTAMTQQGPAEAESVLSDYQEVSGLSIPHKTVTYHDGEKAVEVTLDTVSINPGVDEGLFSLEDAAEME